MSSIYGSRAIPSMTWANRPALAAFPAFQPIFFTDVGSSFTTANRGSEWYHDGSSWRPAGGSAILYTLGSAAQTKSTSLTTETVIAQVLIPAGLISTLDNGLRIAHALNKSGSANTANYNIRFGTEGTTADASLLPAAVGAPSGTARQAQSERYFKRVDATNLIQPFTGGGSYGTSTLVPGVNLVVPNMDSNALYLSFTCFLTSGSETMTATQFDVSIEG